MALQLRSFPAALAGVVSGWARTDEEALMWCGAGAAPVPAEQVSAWASEDGVEQFGLYQGQRLVAFGELWVDEQEAEVELARLIVDPGVRRQGLGQHLAAGLARLARLRHPRVFLRVHPGNTAALRCYAAAGFEPVAPDQAAAWNVGQPFGYVWLSLARRAALARILSGATSMKAFSTEPRSRADVIAATATNAGFDGCTAPDGAGP